MKKRPAPPDSIEPAEHSRKRPREERTIVPNPNAPSWFKDALVMLTKKDLGDEWVLLLDAWAEFELKEKYKDTDLGKTSRPSFIADWIKRKRSATWHPSIGDIDVYCQQFNQWWHSLQPAWRQADNGSVLTDLVDGDWTVLRKSGKNGLLSVLAALFYWGLYNKGKGATSEMWLSAVKDCSTTFSCLSHKA
jgi:hypothetical protein